MMLILMMKALMKMILLILFLLDLLLGIIDLNNVKHVKKDRRKIEVYCIASKISVGLVYDNR